MRFLVFSCFLLSSLFSFAQNKYAYLFSPPDPKYSSFNSLGKNYGEEDLPKLTAALLKQGFLPGNIIWDTISRDKKSFLSQFDKLSAKIKKGDFFLFYTDAFLDPGTREKSLDLRIDYGEPMALEELANKINEISKKINDPAWIFALFNSGIVLKETIPDYSSIPINSLLARLPGEQIILENRNTVFVNALKKALEQLSPVSNTYPDLHQLVENNVLLSTSLQHPRLIFQGSKNIVFNNLLTKKSVYFPLTAQPDNTTVVIKAGENLNVLPGTVVEFYAVNNPGNNNKMLVKGVVTSSTDYSSTVRLEKPYPGAVPALSAAIGLNEKENALVNPVPFNIQFEQSGNASKNKYFQAIMQEIKENPKLRGYINPVSSGGDLQISDIGLLSKDSVSCTIINRRTGQSLKDLFYATKSEKLTYDKNEMDKHSELEEFLIYNAEWQYLSRLHNSIPAFQVNAELKTSSGKNPELDNGYPVLYENEEVILSLHNPSNRKLFFSLLALRSDRSSKLLYPALGESGSMYFIAPGQTFRSEPFNPGLMPGMENLKIITGKDPIEMEELREKNILSRQKSTTAFLPEYMNIQDLEYEVRSSIYNRSTVNKKPGIATRLNGNNIEIENPSTEKIFFTTLKQTSQGDYETIFPNEQSPGVNCYVPGGKKFSLTLLAAPGENQQFIFLFTDRPFVLANYVSEEKSFNELLAEIIRFGRIPGSPINKIVVNQLFVTAPAQPTTRGNSIVIKLVNPKLSADRSNPLQSKSAEYSINGFALTEENKAVQSVKINGELVDYDKDLKFFDKIIRLAGGKNKIVIEAVDEKGFSASQIVEVEFPATETTDLNAKGINYFLGIAVDDYKTWPPLSNAKNDVINFSKLMEQKFGYPAGNMILLFDTAATRKNIIRQIRSFLVKVKPNDNVIIYFSGHGNKDQLTDGDYYFIPCDGEADDVSSAVKSTDILDNFKNIRARNCLLIMDACFSGLISNSVYGQKISLQNSGKNPIDLPSKWILTSGRATKVSDGPPGTNSPFASVMINYLKENKEESKLTISKLIDYLKDNVPKFNKAQIPFGLSIAGEGELVFRIVQ